jgi:dUTP pyrophosphatase
MLNGDTDYQDPHTYSTGLAFEVPEDHVMLVFSRSGHGFKSDVRLSNCVGVIDSDYRGELKVKLTCDKQGWGLEINAGDRVAQGMIIPIEKVQFEEVKELSQTERGKNGFGSTGK